MGIQAICPNPRCGKVFNLKDELAGRKVRCSQCGTVIPVPAAASGQAADLEPQQESVPHRHHPARLVCTNCGAVLGVRDAICRSCGGDVRSGITIMRITAEEKKKAGLRTFVPWMKEKGKQRRPAGRLAVGGVVLLIVAVLVIGVVWLAKSQGYFRGERAQEKAEVADPVAP